MFGTDFDICEVGRIDILGAGGIRLGFFFVEVVDTDYSEAQLNASDFSLSSRLKLSRINLAIGAEQQRDRWVFLCLTRQTDILWVPLWSGALRFLLVKIYGNRGLEIIQICMESWQYHVFGKFMESDFELFWIGKFCWLSGLGGLGENTRDF